MGYVAGKSGNKCIQNLSQNFKKRGHLQDIGVDASKIFKRTFKKQLPRNVETDSATKIRPIKLVPVFSPRGGKAAGSEVDL